MKIYPSLHSIKEVNKVELLDIPLAYIDTSNTEQYISIAKEPIFANGYGESLIKAYEEFDNPEAYLFDSNNEIIKSLILKRIGNKYVYEPQNAVEFTPLRFSFDALIKKNMTFKNNSHYNLRVAVHEESIDLPFSKQLISVFGDAPRRGLCPANISINDLGMTPETLINSSFKDNDFLFAKSSDGIHFKDVTTSVSTAPGASTAVIGTKSSTVVTGNISVKTTIDIYLVGTNKVVTTTVETTTTRELDIDSLLDANVNVWLSVDTFAGILKQQDSSIFTLNQPVLYSTKDYEIKNYGHYFDTGLTHSSFPRDKYTYSTPFVENSAVLIIEKAKGGFLILTHKSFFDNLNDNVKLLYELMMQVFLKSYYRTKPFSSWITDQPVDYIAFKSSKYNLQHAEINLNNLLKNENYSINDEYNLLDINVSIPEVIFVNMNPQKDLFFYKAGIQPDPVKSKGDISVYTSKHSVIHYSQAVIKKIESGLNIDTEIADSGLYITVHPCHSTQHRINTSQDRTLRIEDPRLEYVLCCKPGTTDIENDFVLILANDYTVADGLKVATVKTVNNLAAKTFDLRINGGGLPLDSDPDYNMIDIGHINGRPYRVGSTLIIKLPARFKEHDAKIKEAISKHSSSGDYPVIIYR